MVASVHSHSHLGLSPKTCTILYTVSNVKPLLDSVLELAPSPRFARDPHPDASSGTPKLSPAMFVDRPFTRRPTQEVDPFLSSMFLVTL